MQNTVMQQLDSYLQYTVPRLKPSIFEGSTTSFDGRDEYSWMTSDVICAVSSSYVESKTYMQSVVYAMLVNHLVVAIPDHGMVFTF